MNFLVAVVESRGSMSCGVISAKDFMEVLLPIAHSTREKDTQQYKQGTVLTFDQTLRTGMSSSGGHLGDLGGLHKVAGDLRR